MSDGFFWASRQRGGSEGMSELAMVGRVGETHAKGRNTWRPAGCPLAWTALVCLCLAIPIRCFAQCCPPIITAQPQSQTVTQGVNTTFTVSVSSGTFLTYQWRFNGNNLFAATNSSLTLTNAQAWQVGGYSVAVTNAA